MPPVVAKLATAAFWKALALNVAVAGAVYALSPKPKRFDAGGGVRNRLQLARVSAAPRRIVYGETRASGNIVFQHQTQGVGVGSGYLHLVIVIAAHEVESIAGLEVDGEAVTLTGAGVPDTGEPYEGALRVKYYLGTDSQAADSDLISEIADTNIWSTAHRLRGHAYAYVRLLNDAEKYPNGIPKLTWLVQGRKVYDPRSTTTAYSNNAALVRADYIASGFGLNAGWSGLNESDVIAAANVCDEAVALNAGGNESRYTANGVIYLDETPESILGQLETADAGRTVYAEGAYRIYSGAWSTPSVTLDEDDLIGPLSIRARKSRREVCNGVKGIFVSPDRDWQATDYPAVTNATYTTEDGGERLWRELDLPFTTSVTMAQRLAKIELERSRQDQVVEYPAVLNAYQLQPPDTVQVNNTNAGWSAKTFEVSEATIQNVDGSTPEDPPVLGVSLLLMESASGVYDWNSGEETTFDISPDTTLPSLLTATAPTGLTLTSDDTTAEDMQDGIVLPTILAQWTASTDGRVTGYEVQLRKGLAGVWRTITIGDKDDTDHLIVAVRNAQLYYVRVRAVTATAVVSAWIEDSVTTATRDGSITAELDPVRQTPTANLVFDADFDEPEGVAWFVTTRAGTSEVLTSFDTTVSGGEWASPANAYDDDSATSATGTTAASSNATKTQQWSKNLGSSKTGKIRVSCESTQNDAALDLYYSTDGTNFVKFGTATPTQGLRTFNSEEITATTVYVKAVIHSGFELTAGPPPKFDPAAGAGEVYEIDFVEVTGGTGPYATIENSIAAIHGAGASQPAEVTRPFPGQDPEVGNVLFHDGESVVTQLAARLTGTAADVEVVLYDNASGSEYSLLTIPSGSLTSSWQRWAALFTASGELSGDFEITIRSEGDADVDKIDVHYGEAVRERDELTTGEQAQGRQADRSTGKPSGFTQGDWTSVPLRVSAVTGATK